MAFERRVILLLLILVGLRVVFYGNFHFNLLHSAAPAGSEGDGNSAAVQGDSRGGKGAAAQNHGGGGHHASAAAGAAGATRSADDTEDKNVQEPTFIKRRKRPSWNVLNELRLVDSGIRLVLHKRQFIFYNATLQATTLRRYLEYFDGNETTQYVFPAGVFDHLPLEEPNWHYKTCAVVGNSGIVLLKEKGEEIDAHEAVFRLNLAPVRGFEKYVLASTPSPYLSISTLSYSVNNVRRPGRTR